MSRTWTVETRSAEETLALGRRIGLAAARGDVRLTCIGRAGEGRGVTIVAEGGERRPLPPGGFEHFKPAAPGET